ncbi:hypothetical protein HDU82_007071 [Entophlyctis luteolus]|nr:hypothetical protein HDU82_007071 [Entophlyctis luteolus]
MEQTTTGRSESGASLDPSSDTFEAQVAALIAKEAAELEMKASLKGIAAYSETVRRARQPKPNNRFLSTLVKQVDSHNYDLILKENRRSRELLDELEHSQNRRRATREAPHATAASASPGRQRRHRRDCAERYSPSPSRKRRHRPATASQTDSSTSSSEREPVRGEAVPRLDTRVSRSNVPKVVRGRGQLMAPSASDSTLEVQPTRLDKYFDPSYDPKLDMDNYGDANLDEYVDKLEELGNDASLRKRKGSRKEKKKKDKKKKQKRLERESSESSN